MPWTAIVGSRRLLPGMRRSDSGTRDLCIVAFDDNAMPILELGLGLAGILFVAGVALYMKDVFAEARRQSDQPPDRAGPPPTSGTTAARLVAQGGLIVGGWPSSNLDGSTAAPSSLLPERFLHLRHVSGLRAPASIGQS
jgi:hypothetical protein